MGSLFELTGHYSYNAAPNGKGDLTGLIQIEPDGSFECEITDHASRSPNQFLRGQAFDLNGMRQLAFLKFPDNARLANLAYLLSKSNGTGIEGAYSGEWAALPYKLEYQLDNGLFLASIDMSVAHLKDSSEITLKYIA